MLAQSGLHRTTRRPGTSVAVYHTGPSALPIAFLQATEAVAGEAPVSQNAQVAIPITDISPEALLDKSTPVDGQPAVQGTLDTEQQHAAVYVPDSTVPGSDTISAVHSQSQLHSQGAAAGTAANKAPTSSMSGKSGRAANAACILLVTCPKVHLIVQRVGMVAVQVQSRSLVASLPSQLLLIHPW